MLFDNRLLHLTSQTMIIDLIQMRELQSVEADKVNLSDFDEIIDVRSPSEYEEDNLPNALNMPVLNDEERKLVGTAYKQQSPFVARRKGASIVAHNISKYLKDHFFNKEKTYSPLIYCWRGGERSKSMATFLNSIGWKTTLLEGGYQAYRKHIIGELKQKLSDNYNFKIISGFTGSGKTKLLKYLEANGYQILDLEGLASHKGSALGDDMTSKQPSQKRFERKILEKLKEFNPSKITYIESESSRIGSLQIPAALWTLMKDSPVIEIDVPIIERANFLIKEYKHFIHDQKLLILKLSKVKHLIPKKLYDQWLNLIRDEKYKDFVLSILENHYDRAYSNSRKKTYTQKTEQTYQVEKVSKSEFIKLAKNFT